MVRAGHRRSSCRLLPPLVRTGHRRAQVGSAKPVDDFWAMLSDERGEDLTARAVREMAEVVRKLLATAESPDDDSGLKAL
eukprot:5431601-Prymnesium_polylepis.1